MDIIFIRELTVETIIGIFDWEREIKQPVLFDIEMACDCARAAATDAVDDTLNYKAVSKRVIAFVEKIGAPIVTTFKGKGLIADDKETRKRTFARLSAYYRSNRA